MLFAEHWLQGRALLQAGLGKPCRISSNKSSMSPLCCAMSGQRCLSQGSRVPVWGFCVPSPWGPAARRTQGKAKPAATGQAPMGARGWVWGLQIPGPRQEVIRQVGNQGTSWQGTALGGDEAGAGARRAWRPQ